MQKFLLYYYKNNFENRMYTYIYGKDIDDAWTKAEELYGKDNLETMSREH